MADYIITLDDDQDASIGTPDYNIGVNYEIPSKSVQYQNLILDNIASQFDGNLVCFHGFFYFVWLNACLLCTISIIKEKQMTLMEEL